MLWSVIHCSEGSLFLAPGSLSIIVPPPPPQLLMEHSSHKAGLSPVRQWLLGEPHLFWARTAVGNPQSTGYHGVELGWDSKRALLQTSTCGHHKSTTGCQSYKPKAGGGACQCSAWEGEGRVGQREGSQFYQGKLPSSGRYNNNKALTKLKI